MTRRPRPTDLYDLAVPESPALAPDGSRVAYVLATADRERDRPDYALWCVDVAGGESHRLTAGPADGEPAWSPDGRQLAFVRDDGQVWLLPAAGGEPHRLTDLPGAVRRVAWSPDGRQLAVLLETEPLSAPGAPVVIDRLDHFTDAAGLTRGRRHHVAVVEAGTGAHRQLTDGDWDAGAPAWSPDGTMIAFTGAPAPDADLGLAAAAYVVPADGSRPAVPVGATSGTARAVSWTADGRALLVVGRADTAEGNASLLRVELDGGATADLTGTHDRNVMPGGPAYPGGRPVGRPDGSALVCVRDGGCTHLWQVNDAGERRGLVAGPTQVVSGLSVAGDLAAVVLADETTFGEIGLVEVRTGRLHVLTRHTRTALPDLEFFAPQRRTFPAPDGAAIEGWVLRDPAAPSPGPLVLDVHGGPHNAWTPALDGAHLYHHVLAAAGVTVLFVNPRGSDGYGEAFRTGALGNWGSADEPDVLAAIDALVAEGVADPGRLGVCGYSYGGYLTCHLTSRSDRFAAAVAGGLLADLGGMYGTSDEWRALASQDWEPDGAGSGETLRRQSPIERVAGVTTPTLILHGVEDRSCPVGQAQQWFAALRRRRVETQLVLYPGSSHLFVVNGRPSHRIDYAQRLVDWFAQHLTATRPTRRRPMHREAWQRRLDRLAAEHGVPGAVLGVLRMGEPDEVAVHATGVLSTATGQPVTTDALFQLGSITKSWTATVVLQLVDEGRLELDAPLLDVLPELRLADAELTKHLTMRHLLNHTSGIDGDVLVDTGRGDDCLERYVAQLGEARINHSIGATFSYCNSGYVLAGRVIEVLTGTRWDDALAERIAAPLGLTHTVTLPEDALLFPVATGHVGEAPEPPRPAPRSMLPRSLGPAGLVSSSAADLLAFARLHLTGGRAPDGRRVLSEAAVATMQAHEVDLPDQFSFGDSWGLGWIRYGWGGHRLVGHDGGTIGQRAYLRLLPEAGLAVGLLTNGGQAADLYRDLVGAVFAEAAGVELPPPLEPATPPPPVDAARYVGTYERTGLRTEVFERDGRLVLRSVQTDELAEVVGEPPQERELHPVQEDVFATCEPGARGWNAVCFYRLATGEPYVHYRGRANPKVG